LDKKLLLLILVAAVVLPGILISTPDSDPLYRYMIASFSTFIIILIGVCIGLDNARKFTFRSTMGKSLALVSVGMLVWGLGNLVWFYYNITGIELPYPSLADVCYLGMIPIATFGLFLLLKSIKIRLDKLTVLKIALIPFAMFLLTYLLFIQSKIAEDVDPIVKALNVAYPVGDVIFLSLGFVILSLVRGGKMFKPVGILCLGFIVEAMADFTFSWASTVGIYYVASLSDFLFALAFFILGVGLYSMNELRK
jgi:hypothetical protein